MHLNKQFRYIGLDFETTGLDVNKDEPIQIGLIELNAEGEIIQAYESLIKPNKKTDELKHIVNFITGLRIEDLNDAPQRDVIAHDIQKFFGPDTIIIGHNVKFDLGFLNKYFPELTYHSSIDTMQLAQTIVHYASSYALDVLVEDLQSEEKFKKILNEKGGKEEKAHDAFDDTKNSLRLFLYFTNYTADLAKKYPNLIPILTQTQGIRNEIFEAKEAKDIPQVTINFPALEKIAPNHRSLSQTENSLNTDALENQKRYFIGNTDIQSFLTAIASNKNIILAFQNIQKLNIAKTILNEIGIKNVGFIKEDQTINQQTFQSRLNKSVFNESEFLFVVKYLSHLDRGLGLLDLNNANDYKIYHFIKDTRDKTKFPIILTTHHGLYAMLNEDNDEYPDYDICFFDTERRYKTYNFFLSCPVDMYYTLNYIESLLYQENASREIKKEKEATLSPLHEFYNLFQVFIGVLFADTKKLFTNTEAVNISHDPIRGHGDFYQTGLLRTQVQEKLQAVKPTLNEKDFKVVDKQMTHIHQVMDGVVNMIKKMYGTSDFYFVYAEAQKYTDWKEFLEIFKNKVIFFSNTNIQLTPAITKEQSTLPPKQKMSSISNIAKIIEHIKAQPEKEYSIFIFSPKKEESKKIFEDLCQNNIHKESTLLVENITGGIGKNIFKAKQAKNKIIIGGNNFLLYLYASKVTINEIILFNIHGGSEQSILDDMKRYSI